jgi:hypothetical protein
MFSTEGSGMRGENSDVFGGICDIFSGVKRENILCRVRVNNRPIRSMQHREL